MDLHLAGKTILVTGGASGIGEGIVRELLAEDANPVILDRDAERAARIEGAESRILDLTDENAISEAVASCKQIDGVVNNAGINDGVGLDGSPEDFRRSLELNLVQCFTLVHHAAPKLRESKGAIVNIGSKVALTGQGGTSGYAASKGGLAALTREWALDLAKDGVRVNAVLPAEVWTPMYERWISSLENPEGRKAEIEARIPLGHRMTTPEEIAAMAVFMLSPRSSHTTGQILHVDGGYVHLDRAAS